MIDLRCFGAKHMKRRQPESGFSPTQVGYPPPILGCSPQAFNNFKRIKVASTFVKGLRMEKAVEFGCSPFSQLPDDIVVQIYNKVMDLKTLCYCQLISKRLGLIVFEADTISFNVPLRIDYENENRLDDMKILYESFRLIAFDYDHAPLLGSDSFPSAIKFIKRFMNLKSICIQFPAYVDVVSGVSVFKSIKFSADPWLVIFFSNDFLHLEEGVDEGRENTDEDEDSDEYFKTYSCLMDVVDRFKKVLGCTIEFPLLEKVFIMDSSERGIVTLRGGEIDKLRNFLPSTSKHQLLHLV